MQALVFVQMHKFRINCMLSSVKPFLELLTLGVITIMTANVVIMPNDIICINLVHIRELLDCIIVAP